MPPAKFRISKRSLLRMKIIAIAQNYGLPCEAAVTGEPVFFLKPDSALLKDGKPFFIPDFTSQVDAEASLVVRICRLGKNIAPRFAHRYYDAFTVGVDFTARDLLCRAQREGLPWEAGKCFDASAAIGSFVPKERCADVQNITFGLQIDGREVQHARSGEMRCDIDHLIAHVSRFMTLKMGDLLFTGTPSGAETVAIGQCLQGFVAGEKVLDFHVR